ncbi:MAG: hypothetical protein HWN65_18715 [Candidatus Helarchaeota archaeon]|nr:hypothetical protein [Candidatus Helarchaeota archaeon]
MSPMQTAYIRIVRKIKSKSDGETAIAKDIVKDGIGKMLGRFSQEPGIIEASRKLYATAIKTYKTPTSMIADAAKEGANLLFEKFGTAACGEILLIFSSAIAQYFQLEGETLAKPLAEEASTFFKKVGCEGQATKVIEILDDPRTKSEFKMF